MLRPEKFKDDEVLSRRTMRCVIFPELDELAEPPNAKYYPYEKTAEEGLNGSSLHITHVWLIGRKWFPDG